MALRNIPDGTWARIGGGIRWTESQRGINYGPRRTRNITGAASLIVAKSASAAITARSSETPGTGLVDFYEMGVVSGSTDPTLSAVTGSSDQTVYNIATSEVAADTFLLIQKDEDGYYWVVVEDCG